MKQKQFVSSYCQTLATGKLHPIAISMKIRGGGGGGVFSIQLKIARTQLPDSWKYVDKSDTESANMKYEYNILTMT